MSFTKATKTKKKLRLALFGPSGSGKTMTALRIATGMVAGTDGRIALIDTEYGSASMYADRFDFDSAEEQNPNVDRMIEVMGQATDHAVLIIDSGTHAWQELLEEVDLLAKSKYKGNTWSAWSEGTPKQKRLVRAILGFPGHLIMTMRSKTEWQTVKDDKGNAKPQRIGLAPEQGKGIEYEFDMLMEVSPEHIVEVIKDRTGKYQDKIIQKPDEKLGRELVEWLNTGAEPPPAVIPLTAERRSILVHDIVAVFKSQLVTDAERAGLKGQLAPLTTAAELEEFRRTWDVEVKAREATRAESRGGLDAAADKGFSTVGRKVITEEGDVLDFGKLREAVGQ